MMILSYRDIHDPDQTRRRIQATVSTDLPDGSRGQALIMLEDGRGVHMKVWAAMDYRVEKTTEEEREILERMGLI